ncbi:MAG: acyltransferase, partial [Actinomyces sp.]
MAAVVAYHLRPDLVPGGWLGVSIFFTLSGFLVVGLLDDERRRLGRVDLGRFWERRARRLLPAVLATIAATVLATAALAPGALDRVVGDAVAGVAYVANWRLAADPGGYGALFDGGVRPLDHLWS